MKRTFIVALAVLSVNCFAAEVEIKKPKYTRTSEEGFPHAVTGEFSITCESEKDRVCEHLGFTRAIDFVCKKKKVGTLSGRASAAVDCGLNALVGGPRGMCDSQGSSNAWVATISLSPKASMRDVNEADVITKIVCE